MICQFRLQKNAICKNTGGVDNTITNRKPKESMKTAKMLSAVLIALAVGGVCALRANTAKPADTVGVTCPGTTSACEGTDPLTGKGYYYCCNSQFCTCDNDIENDPDGTPYGTCTCGG
jgi:hypothetical protein